MRDMMIVTATVCAVCGLVVSSASLFDRNKSSWNDGFVTGCAAMALTAFLAAILVAAWMR